MGIAAGSSAKPLGVAFVIGLGLAIPEARSQQIGLVTLSASEVGGSVSILQSVAQGQTLETEDGEALGFMIQDVVFHVGGNSNTQVSDEAGRKRLILERGYVVFYLDPANPAEVIVETPFGFLKTGPDPSGQPASGWFSVRHDPGQPNVSRAESQFGVIEGIADVSGTNPVAGPHRLTQGQLWRIVEGQIPGPPQTGDVRTPAEELRNLLHRRTADLLRVSAELEDIPTDGDLTLGPELLNDTIVTEGQMIVTINDTVTSAPVPPPIPPPVDVLLPPSSFPDFAAGEAVSTQGNFVALTGTPFFDGTIPGGPNWEDVLTGVSDPNDTGALVPAFSPEYVAQLDNGGFSYLQFAGPNAQLQSLPGGESFFVQMSPADTGWGFFTPQTAIGDSGFSSQSPLVQVVTEGFRAIGRAEHLAGRGALTGTGPGDPEAFVNLNGRTPSINGSQPVGFPLLDRATASNLLEEQAPFSDQMAAIGQGLNPETLNTAGGRPLLFLSASDMDANGSSFDFNGQAIRPTDLRLPGELGEGEIAQETIGGSASRPSTLTGDRQPRHTVGIQFAGQGEVVAVIHHDGRPAAADQTPPIARGPFLIERGNAYSIVRWREDGRPTNAQGALIEFEDLAGVAEGDPLFNVRNDLFVTICREVNFLNAPRQLGDVAVHTVCGPAAGQPVTARTRSTIAAASRVLGSSPEVSRVASTPIRATTRPSAILKPGSTKPADRRLNRPERAGIRPRNGGKAQGPK